MTRIIVLDELINEPISVHDEVIDSILANPDLYAVTETASYISVALRRRWPEWNESVRAAILNNIMNARYLDADQVLPRIDLLSAIPENDVPSAFVPLLSLLRDKGWTDPKSPDVTGVAVLLRLSLTMKCQTFFLLPAALSPECAERWRALRLSESIDTLQGKSSLDDMIAVARNVVDCLPAPSAIGGALWMMHSVIRVLHHLRGQLADVLRNRVDSDGPALMATPRANAEEGWETALEYGCKLLAEIGVAADTSEELRSKVFGILTTWAAPPLSIRGALDGAQRVRKRVI